MNEYILLALVLATAAFVLVKLNLFRTGKETVVEPITGKPMASLPAPGIKESFKALSPVMKTLVIAGTLWVTVFAFNYISPTRIEQQKYGNTVTDKGQGFVKQVMVLASAPFQTTTYTTSHDWLGRKVLVAQRGAHQYLFDGTTYNQIN